MSAHLIHPAGSHIRKTDICVETKETSWGIGENIVGLRFFDKDGLQLLESGFFYPDNARYMIHSFAINEDERVVGMRSKGRKEPSWKGVHYDPEFFVCKLK